MVADAVAGLSWGQILITCAISVLRNDRKCIYICLYVYAF